MKILHLRSSEFFGGPERAIIGQCRHLKKFEMLCGSFIRGDKSSQFLSECENAGIKTIVIPDSFAGDIRLINKIKNIIENHRIDLIVSHDYKSNFFSHYAVKKTRCRQAAHFRGWTAEDTKDKFYNWINWTYLKKIPAILTVSETTKGLLVRRGIDSERIKVVFNAIECDESIIRDRRNNRASEDLLNVVAAGRLSREKGYDILLEAVSLIRESPPPFMISIYGHGPDEEMLKNMAEKLGITDVIKFCGFVDDIKPIFRRADFMVLPSRSEGMPNVVLEAWSQKLGVLSTAVGGVPEMIEPGQNGLLVPSEDPKALGEGLLQALNNPAKMDEYGEKGFETVRERYSYQKQAELLEKIYMDIVNS
ncbi:MAG: glycosyltransferase family 4 protein [Candidatus Zixiibacteriota bacterium]